MNFLLIIFIPELVVLFGSGFGGSQLPPESPHLSLPPSNSLVDFTRFTTLSEALEKEEINLVRRGMTGL